MKKAKPRLVRAMVAMDLPQVYDIELQSAAIQSELSDMRVIAWEMQDLRHYLARTMTCPCHVIECADGIAAFSVMEKTKMFSYRMHNLATRQSWQQKGICDALLQFVLEKYSRCCISMMVRKHNQPVKHVLGKHGFTLRKIFFNAYDNIDSDDAGARYEDGLLMVREPVIARKKPDLSHSYLFQKV